MQQGPAMVLDGHIHAVFRKHYASGINADYRKLRFTSYSLLKCGYGEQCKANGAAVIAVLTHAGIGFHPLHAYVFINHYTRLIHTDDRRAVMNALVLIRGL